MRIRRLTFEYRRPLSVLLIQLSAVVIFYSFLACTRIAAFVPSLFLSSSDNNNDAPHLRHPHNTFTLYSAERRGQRKILPINPPIPSRVYSISNVRTNDNNAPERNDIISIDNDDLYDDVATQLLKLVLEKRDKEIENSTIEAWIKRSISSYENTKRKQSNQIENLIEKLIRPTLDLEQQRKRRFYETIFDRKNTPLTTGTYDPTKSLFGCGFFGTLYWYYPNNYPNNNHVNSDADKKSPKEEDPLWEQLSLIPSNIKGQQYYVCNNFQQSVINYSEILGSNIFVTAEGTVSPISSSSSLSSSNEDDTNTNTRTKTNANNTSSSDSDKFSSLSSSSSSVKNSRRLRTLPDVFKVDATKISLSVFGLSINFSIQGSANLVVLYADPRIRIFVSPMESRSFVGNWEEAGLVVVQVRSDLISMTKNQDISKIIDFR